MQAISFSLGLFSFPIYFLQHELSPVVLTILVDTVFNFYSFGLTWDFTLNSAVGRRLDLLWDAWITEGACSVIWEVRDWVSYCNLSVFRLSRVRQLVYPKANTASARHQEEFLSAVLLCFVFYLNQLWVTFPVAAPSLQHFL